MNAKEMWKDIPEYEGYYQASTFGRIRSVDRVELFYQHTSNKKHLRKRKGKILSIKSNRVYQTVQLHKNGEEKLMTVHRVVALTFIPNPENKPTVNHKNGVKTDNRIVNLEWATRSEQTQHAYNTKLMIPPNMKEVFIKDLNMGVRSLNDTAKYLIENNYTQTKNIKSVVCNILRNIKLERNSYGMKIRYKES